MSVRQIRLRRRKVWQARVQYKGGRASQICATKDEARQTEAELFQRLKAAAGQAEAEGAQPATLRSLCEAYSADLEARGKGPDTVTRAAGAAKALEAVLPDLMDRPLTEVKAADVFGFRQARARAGIKPSTINRDLRSLRAMLKKARPEFPFPGGAFAPEDETRVR